MAPSGQKGVSSSLSKLTLEPTKTYSQSTKSKSKKVVADSWEDEDDNSDSDSDSEGSATGRHDDSKTVPSAPPPTPMSPTYSASSRPWSPESDATPPAGLTSPDPSSPRRPEKTDAVARRMIASALGVKVPKQTEEQKAYEKAIKEKEKKRKEEEKAAERRRLAEAEKAKSAVWED